MGRRSKNKSAEVSRRQDTANAFVSALTALARLLARGAAHEAVAQDAAALHDHHIESSIQRDDAIAGRLGARKQ